MQRLIKFFEDVLGYNALTDISREAEMKGKYVDVVLKVDGTIRLLIEAKAAGEKLRDRHIEQAQAYASRNNYQWVVLTNGVDWHLYHLTFGDGIDYVRAFEVDLSSAEALDVSAEKLALLHRVSVKKGELEDFWATSTALSPKSIGKALFCEDTLLLIRREIRREEELIVDIEDLAQAIHNMMTPEARELTGPLKVRKKRAAPARKAAASGEIPTPKTDPSADEPDGNDPQPA